MAKRGKYIVSFLAAFILAVLIIWYIAPSQWIIALVFGVIFGVIGVLLCAAVSQTARDIRCRLKKWIPLLAVRGMTKEQVEYHLLTWMQYSSDFERTLASIKMVFYNYPDYRLNEWEPFLAWYKYNMDFYLSEPGIYTITLDNGKPYSTSIDPLYHADAKSWDIFDRDHSDDDKYIRELWTDSLGNVYDSNGKIVKKGPDDGWISSGNVCGSGSTTGGGASG